MRPCSRFNKRHIVSNYIKSSEQMTKQQKSAKSVDSYIVGIIEESVKATLRNRALQEK